VSAAWWTIVVAGIATFAMRASFLVFAHRLAVVPPIARRVLRQIPPAALAALVLPAFLRPEGRFDLWSPELGAGVLAAVIAWRTRNAVVTLVVGLAALAVLEVVIG